MLKLTIALAGLAAAAACAGPAPDRGAPPGDMPRRELEIARVEEPQTTRSAPSKPPEKRSAEPAPEPAPTDTAPAVDTAAPPGVEGTSPPDSVLLPEPIAQPGEGTDTVGYTPYPAAEPAPQTTELPPSTPAPDGGGILAAGTVIHAILEDSIHSRIDVSGSEVQGRVMQNVTGSDGEVLIPAGSPVRFTVTQVKPGRGGRRGVLEMRTDSITIQGQPREVEATIRAVPHELRGRGVTAEDAAKVGVGAAGGAVVGRVITGDAKGAVIGGVVGAAGGAVVASETAQKDVVVKARTPVELVLTAPLLTR